MATLADNEITERTVLVVKIQVKKSAGDNLSLTGATFHAVMGRTGLSVNGTVTVVDAATGMLQVAFPAATGMKGFVNASVHVTIAGQSQCVWREKFQVFADFE